MLHEVDGVFVPRGDEPGNLDLFAKAVDFGVVLFAEFQTVLEVAVRCAEGVGARCGEFGCGVDDFDGALLELDGIAACGDGYGDEALGKVNVTVVIDADLGDDIAGLACSELLVADVYCGHGCLRAWFLVRRVSGRSGACVSCDCYRNSEAASTVAMLRTVEKVGLAEVCVVFREPVLARRGEDVEVDGVFEGFSGVREIGGDDQHFVGANDLLIESAFFPE